MSSCLELGEGREGKEREGLREKWNVTLHGCGVSFWGRKKVNQLR